MDTATLMHCVLQVFGLSLASEKEQIRFRGGMVERCGRPLAMGMVERMRFEDVQGADAPGFWRWRPQDQTLVDLRPAAKGAQD